ncbi:uncharacterized protein [Asterias amurensis]
MESLCQPGFNYTQTAMTSSLRDLLRDDRNLKMLQNLPFAELECSPYLQNLLCAFYATRCGQEGGRPALFPCRELCAEVKSGCATVMESFGFRWPENLECERFPSHSYGQECNLEDFRVPPLDDDFYGNLQQDHGSCEPITVKICTGSGVLHSQTRTPIAVPFGSGLEDFNLYPTQREAFDVIAPYTTLLSRGGGCQEFLKPLVCGTYLPACGVGGHNVTLPCKDLCMQAQSSCRLSMLRHGLQWPSSLDCNRFPTEEENPECLSALSLGEASESDVSTSVRVPCTFSLSPTVQPQWLTPDGTLVSSDTDMRVFVEATDKHVTDLIIEGFIDSVHSGKYTCTAGNFSRSVTLGDISQPAPVNKVSVAEVVSQSILGITIKSVSCTYDNLPAFQPKWLNPDGVEITDDVHSRIKVNYVSDSITGLSIHDFTDSVDAGTYVCTGAHEDSAVPVLIGDTTNMENTTIPDEGPDHSSCEEIRVPACMTGIAYSSTFVPSLTGLSQDDVAASLESFSLILDNGCSAYFRPYMCSLFLPPCGKKAVAPCQELCLKAVDGCSGPIPESLRESCSSLPKESDDLIECYNVNEDTIMYNTTIPDEGPVITDQSSCEEIRVPACMTGIAYSSTQIPNLVAEDQDFAESLMESFSPILDSDCSAYLRPYICSLFLPPCGKRAVAPCQELCLKAFDGCSGLIPESLRESCSSLPKESDGLIECYNVNEDTIMNNTTIPDEGTVITDQSSCEEIRVPACMTGIAYSSTFVPSLTGLNQDQVASNLESFSLILDNACSAYFRPYMCSLYLPPCREKAVVPCQELCLKAVNDCASTLAGSFSQGQVTALRDACSSVPSEADDFSECYNVNEVSVDEVVSQTILGITMKSVRCTYNFLPAFQPKWFTPEGVEITDDVNSPIKVNYVSDSVTELSISDFADSFVTGTYVCTGAHEDSAVPVVIGDATNMDNTTIPGIPDQSWNCSLFEFVCNNRECISSTLVCDNNYDCADESDEAEELCKTSSSGCSVDEHACLLSGECLKAVFWCDGKFDCADNSDENNCSLLLVVAPANVSQVSSTRIDVSLECSSLFVYHTVQEQPAWITADGDTIAPGSSLLNTRVEYVNDFTSRLIIEGYTDEANGGTYVCGVYSFEKSTRLVDLNPKQIGENCEEIRVSACMTGIGYSSTYIPSIIGLNQDEVETLMESFSLILDNACSAYFRPYMCSLYLPPCREKAIIPCQELCLKAVNECASTLAGSFSQTEVTALRDACASMPSEADGSSECYNVNEVSVEEVSSYTSLGRTDKYVECHYNLLPVVQPKWFNPDGVEITDDYTSRIKVHHFSDNVTALSIREFTDSVDAGTYVCTGSHEDSAVPVLIGDTTNIDNTTVPDEGPDHSSCEEIRVPACMTGIAYSSTFVPSLTGLNQDQVAANLENFSLILENACSAYFRPYMCSLYLPPCREKAVVPCQELCLKAVNDCASTLAGSFSYQEIFALRESCASMPSEADGSSECYNVKEVEIGELYGVASVDGVEKYVECTYNLLPELHPKWSGPDGLEIAGPPARVSSVEISSSVTRLRIRDYDASIDEGTYTCHGRDQTVSVDL